MVISNSHRSNPIPLKRTCVLSYICLLLTKVLFETSCKSFQYNTKDRRLSNYLIKLILCSHHRSRYKGLCQNKKAWIRPIYKGRSLLRRTYGLKAILQVLIYKALYDKSYLGSKTTMTSGEWTCLISFATAPLTCSERGGSEKFKMKIYVSSGIRTHTPPVHDRKVAAP